ncbi:ABC transporter ATP-binding protein [Spirochaetota bacterium]
MKPVLEIKNLSVEFQTREGTINAVNGLSYNIGAGMTLGIAGESGSGKTVSSLAVMGLLHESTARIGKKSSIKISCEETRDMSKSRMREIRGNTVSMIFQDPMNSLNPYRRIDQQMIEGYIYHKKAGKKNALKKAFEMLEYVHIADVESVLRSYPHELSGGMRQRVMIATALTCNPSLIFADEPTSSLDVTVQSQIIKLFNKIQGELNTAIVFITHDLELISIISDYILVMYAGQMMEYGSPEDIFEKPLHPYTMALKKCIPKLHISGENNGLLHSIKGSPPDPMNLSAGCPFEPRCEFSKEACRLGDIPAKQLGNEHIMRCIL